jgi:hypothetical protein
MPVVQDYFAGRIAKLRWLVNKNPIEAYHRADSYRRWLAKSPPTGNIVYDAQKRLMVRAVKKIMADAQHNMTQQGKSLPKTEPDGVVYPDFSHDT